MNITSVRYRELATLSGYNNVAIEAEAEVGSNTPDEAVEKLKKWVQKQIADVKERERMESTIEELFFETSSLEKRRDSLRLEVQEYRDKINDIRDLIQRADHAGVTIPESLHEDTLPF